MWFPSMLLLTPSALAEDAPAEAPPAWPVPPAEATDAATDAIAALEAADARTLLEAARTLLSPEGAPEAKIEAAQTLATSGDPAALALLEAAVDARDVATQRTALQAIVLAPGDLPYTVAVRVMGAPFYVHSLRESAIHILGGLGTPAAGEALWTAGEDRRLPTELRELARAEVARSYPQLLVERGAPSQLVSLPGVAIGAAANGMTGGIMLSAIGTWGQNEVATTIGAIGGGLIGGGTGVLYGLGHDTTLGQGMSYASGATWGLIGSMYGSYLLFGPNPDELWVQYDTFGAADSAQRRWDNLSAGARLVGTLGGSALGFREMRGSPQPSDVIEVNLSTYLGQQVGLSLADLIGGRESSCAFDYGDSGETNVDCAGFIRSARTRSGAALAGMGLGAGLGTLAAPRWEMGPGAIGLGLVGAAESGWIGGWLPVALSEEDYVSGAIRLGVHGGAAGTLALAQRLDPSPKQAAMAAWGMLLGNGLGASLPMLAGASDTGVVARAMLPVGLLGTVGGAALAPHMPLSVGDATMLGVGVPLGSIQGLAMANVIESETNLEYGRASGLRLGLPTLAGIGFTALTAVVEPTPEDVLFLGSAGVWGVWYGALTPVALDVELDNTGYTLAGMLTGDAFLVAGRLALSERTVNLSPRRTVVPQLMGVTGATLGALGAALVSPDGSAVAGGGLIGSTLGLIGGGVYTARHPERGLPKTRARRGGLMLPELDPPGEWAAMLAPGPMEDGSTGVVMSLSVTGL